MTVGGRAALSSTEFTILTPGLGMVEPMIASPPIEQAVDWPRPAAERVLQISVVIPPERDMTPTNPKIRPLPEGVDLTMIDPAEMLDNRKKWDELWTNTVLKPR